MIAELPRPANTMFSHSRHVSLEEMMAYENSAVVARIAKENDLNTKEAEDLFDDTKRFLYLCGITAHSDPIAPPALIDEGWHTFILFTEDYADFCQRFFGRFIHHRPRRPEDPPGDGGVVRRTLALVESVFGGKPSERWEFPTGAKCEKDCKPSTNCQEAPPPDCAKN